MIIVTRCVEGVDVPPCLPTSLEAAHRQERLQIIHHPNMNHPRTHEEGKTGEARARPDKIFLDVQGRNLQKPQKG